MPGSGSGLGKRTRHQPDTAPQADSTPTLHAQLVGLPWPQVPVAAEDRDRGHGRVETRRIKITAVGA